MKDEGDKIQKNTSNENYFITDNGIKVFVKTIPNAKCMNCNIDFNLGGVYEKQEENGLSHFLEHMLIRKDKIEFEQKYNCQFDAGTTSIKLNISYTDILKDKFEDGFKEIFNIISKKFFSQDALEKEREAILIEYDNKDRFYGKNCGEAVYGESPLGKITIGSKDNIRSFTLDDILKFYNTFILPENMTITISGDVDIQDVKEILNRSLPDEFVKHTEDKKLFQLNEKLREYDINIKKMNNFQQNNNKAFYFYQDKKLEEELVDMDTI